MDDNDHSKGYEGDQIALINNNIVFTDNGFETVKMAIGRFKDETRGDCFGVVAPNIVGTLLASKKLMIQAKTEDNKTVLFQVDENGAKLHNADFNIYAHGNQLSLNPDIGIAMGKEPIYTKTENGVEIKKENASFYADIETGDAFFKGTIRAAKYLDQNGEEMMVPNTYKFAADYLDLHGLTIKNPAGTTTLHIDSNGNITMKGNITLTNGAQNGTFITGTNIYSPKIESPEMIWYEDTDAEEKPVLGTMGQEPGDDGSGTPTVLLKVISEKGIGLQAKTGGISLEAQKGIWLKNLTTAQSSFSVRGILSIASTGACPPLTNKDGWVNVEQALGKLEKRLSDLETTVASHSNSIASLWDAIGS